MKTPKSLMMIGIATLAASALAQNANVSLTNAQLQTNVVLLSTNAEVEMQQDTLSISLTTTKEGNDAATVQNQLKMALDAALSEAKKAALPGQMDVQTGSFSLYPRYARDGKLNGWQGSTELVLHGTDFARISGTAGKIQTMTLGNVSFSLSRDQRQKAEAQAQAMAIERYKAKAADIAKGFGFTGYTLREVSVNANGQEAGPRIQMMPMAAKAVADQAPVPVEAGKTSVQVSVSGSVQLR